VKKYEGLFILDTAGKEETVKDIIDKVSNEITGYVLGAFRGAEAELLEKVLTRACDQIECWLDEGIGKAMNRYNGRIVLNEEESD